MNLANNRRAPVFATSRRRSHSQQDWHPDASATLCATHGQRVAHAPSACVAEAKTSGDAIVVQRYKRADLRRIIETKYGFAAKYPELVKRLTDKLDTYLRGSDTRLPLPKSQ